MGSYEKLLENELSIKCTNSKLLLVRLANEPGVRSVRIVMGHSFALQNLHFSQDQVIKFISVASHVLVVYRVSAHECGIFRIGFLSHHQQKGGKPFLSSTLYGIDPSPQIRVQICRVYETLKSTLYIAGEVEFEMRWCIFHFCTSRYV